MNNNIHNLKEEESFRFYDNEAQRYIDGMVIKIDNNTMTVKTFGGVGENIIPIGYFNYDKFERIKKETPINE